MRKVRLNIDSPGFYTLCLIGILALRLILNSIVPLMDTTEARYSEIARLMVETNNWITPQIDYGVPFWAKPPLSTWLSAMSIKVFGVNEFAVRLPAFVLSLGMIFLLGSFSKEKRLPFFLSGFIILTLPEFLLHAGVVSTDTSLAFCVTLIMVSFWKSISLNKISIWSYLFFIGIGLGLLAKGPIVLILILPPIMVWGLLYKEHFTILRSFPWLKGIIIMALIALPWYYLAELRSKGFIDYFIVGEHFRRYFDSSWTGDKYGFPKTQPYGIIWVFLFIFSYPWIQLVAIKVWRYRNKLLQDKWVSFLLLWLIWTPLFFTVSSSLIHPYILPVMAPVALLVIHFWETVRNKKSLIIISLALPVLMVITLSLGLVNRNLEHYSNTDKYLIKGQTDNAVANLYYYGTKSYSSQFYSGGKVVSLNHDGFIKLINEGTQFVIIIPDKSLKKIEKNDLEKLQRIKFNYKKGLYQRSTVVAD